MGVIVPVGVLANIDPDRALNFTVMLTAPSNVEMDSSWMAVRHRCAKLSLRSQLKPYQKESTHELYDCRG